MHDEKGKRSANPFVGKKNLLIVVHITETGSTGSGEAMLARKIGLQELTKKGTIVKLHCE